MKSRRNGKRSSDKEAKPAKHNRREFLQTLCAASATAAAGGLLPGAAHAEEIPRDRALKSAQGATGVMQVGPTPDTVYVNGAVITVDPEARTLQAVAVEGDRIIAVGSNEEIRKMAVSGTRVVDLANKTMTPGFVDSHSHFPGSGMEHLYEVNCSPPPVGAVNSIDDIIQALKAKAQQTPPGQWVLGYGYDQSLVKEMRQPTRWDLDKASTANPILLEHNSGHLAVVNSLALKMAGIGKNPTQPNEGGVIDVDPKTGEPTGLLEEHATGLVYRLIPPRTKDQLWAAIKWDTQNYLRAGVTTSVQAGSNRQDWLNMQAARRDNLLAFRFHIWVSRRPQGPAECGILTGFGDDWMKVGAIGELPHDGSLQGYTGYLSTPYYTPYKGDPFWRGFPNESREELIEYSKRENREGYQISIHGNGDAAIQDIIDSYDLAYRDFPRQDTRFRIDHCQTVREDQLDQIKALGITPTFFVSHTYYWGDQHRDIFLGPERAARISPLRSAIQRGIRFTIHLDSPVTPMSPLQAMWSAVNRLTRTGKVLGPEQRITPFEALRAITIDGAYQVFEEKTRGSIEPGKMADFTILQENPLTIDPVKIRDIPILQTIVGGKTVYSKT